MKILVTGATGLIGSELGQRLVELGHTILVVSRSAVRAREQLTFDADIIECDLNKNVLGKQHFVGVDAIINLAGETVGQRWTPNAKTSILNSRVITARNLLKNCPGSVQTIITVSAQGIYGDSGEKELTENSLPADDFLAQVCRAWEAEFANRENRVVILRLGMVLSRKGGVLQQLTDVFQRNLGAPLGSGQQWMSYIGLDDVVNVFTEALEQSDYRGVINTVCEHPVRNSEFTGQLCRHLGVIQLPKIPAFVVRVLLGEMADLVLFSQRVKSKRLSELGFKFQQPTLEDVFNHELYPSRNRFSLFYAEQFIPYGIDQVFGFFANHENLEKITPDMLNFQTEKMSTARVEKDTLIDYKLRIRGIPMRWRTLIKTWNRPHEFVDTQIKGPYAYWRHTHKFRSVRNGTLMVDEVRYRVPLGALGRLVAGGFVRQDVSKIFAFRRRVIANLNFDE